MARYGQRAEYWNKLLPALEIITEKDEKKAIPRRTIFYKEHKGDPPYSIFESGRIQEQLFGVTILLDAYRLTGDKRYFDYLTGALDCVLEHHFDHGMIYTDFLNGEKEDYTTVCCLMIPFVDAALALKEENSALAEKYRAAAGEIAGYLYRRESFHTEAFVSDNTEAEMEDGSISCTALSLLYYCAKIERKEDISPAQKKFSICTRLGRRIRRLRRASDLRSAGGRRSGRATVRDLRFVSDTHGRFGVRKLTIGIGT